MTEGAQAAQGASSILGIDLGTTNSALVTWAGGDHALMPLAIPQLLEGGQMGAAAVLPSTLYLPHEGELASDQRALPWEQGLVEAQAPVTGQWARRRAGEVPGRAIVSAKSWLTQGLVDRRAPILPWRSDEVASKLSPVETSAHYLRHLMAAAAAAGYGDGEPSVVLTVPASFDDVARTLTFEAAQRAGIQRPILLEEPLAAFYAWIAANDKGWQKQVQPGELVLVCDVGGGTTDFSLIAVGDDAGRLALTRISVGDHLLLGGDNMDLALAHLVKGRLQESGKGPLDHWQFLSLVAAVRTAKERLLTDGAGLASVPISIAARGASLFATTIATELAAADVAQFLVEGFFPVVDADAEPKGRRSVGIQELGLPFETDAAVTRHLARFLRKAQANLDAQAKAQPQLADLLRRHLSDAKLLLPSAVLFNGGVFKSQVLRDRLLKQLASWQASDGQAVRELLPSDGVYDLDLAVARGAAYYGRLRATGKGVRVQSGTARSYYVGLEEALPAVPGFEPTVKGLCLVPQGTDEGTHLSLSGRRFGLVVGEPVEFRFFSSTGRAGDAFGTVIEDAEHVLEENARLGLTLPADAGQVGEVVPVELDAQIDEVGVLRLAMRQPDTSREWRLEFDVRPHEQA